MFVNWRTVIRENVRNIFCYLVLCLDLFPLLGERVVVAFHFCPPWNYYFVCDYLSVQFVLHSWHKGGRSILPEGKGEKKAIEGLSKSKCLKVKGRARLTSQKKMLVSVAMLVTQSHKVLFLKASKKIIVHQLLDWCKSRWFYWLWWSYVDLYQMRIWPTVWRYFYFSSHSIS